MTHHATIFVCSALLPVVFRCGWAKDPLNGFNCTFDSDFCGWHQDASDEFDWLLHSGPTGTPLTGLPSDHTTGTGNYTYLEAGYPRRQDDAARLVFSNVTGTKCITLFLYMFGAAVGHLNLYVDQAKALSVSGSQEEAWIKAQVQINASQSEITLEGVIGRAWQGDIALDDVSIADKCNVSSCPPLNPPANGNLTCTMGSAVGSECTASCHVTYNLQGSVRRFCLVNGLWSGTKFSCVKIEVRLAGSSLALNGSVPTQGRIELAVNGEWGTVCDDYIKVNVGHVICRMLGLGEALAMPGDSAFGNGTGRIWLSDPRCNGTESSILNCNLKGLGAYTFCDHSEDAGLICGALTDFKVRLADGRTSNEGRVEVAVNGVWGTVCDDKWGLPDAQVVCRSLGLPPATAATGGSSFGAGGGAVLLDDVECAGNETSLLDCSRADLGVKDCAHFEDSGVVCGPPAATKSLDIIKSDVSGSKLEGVAYVTDGNYSTSFTVESDANPWFRVHLVRNVYIYSVHVFSACCPTSNKTRLNVSIGANGSVTGHCSAGTQEGFFADRGMHVYYCQPPPVGRYITVHATGGSSFCLCETNVYGIGSLGESKGILREVWHEDIDTQDQPILKYNPVFQKPAERFDILQTFSVSPSIASRYGQRLSAFAQVSVSGVHRFYLACEDECELWVRSAVETGLQGDDATGSDDIFVKLSRRTEHLKWDEFPEEQRSEEIYLRSCVLYEIEAFSKESYRRGHLSVALGSREGSFVQPLGATNLTWFLTGQRSLYFELDTPGKRSCINFGDSLVLSGTYRYCCEGMFCPSCPLKIVLDVFLQSFVLEDSLNMSCSSSNFSRTVRAAVQPGDYAIELRYLFSGDDMNQQVRRRKFGHVTVNESVVEECAFDDRLCQGWSLHDGKEGKGWEFSSASTSSGGFYSATRPGESRMTSKLIGSTSSRADVNFCLRFSYLMTSSEPAAFSVLRGYAGREEVLMTLSGYHGPDWAGAQVTWASSQNVHIVFVALIRIRQHGQIAVDDVRVTTGSCELEPYYAEPGHKCQADEFRCDNGACIDASLRCDGDYGCSDESDETGCTCLSGEFSCPTSGRCVPVTSLCDGTEDCQDAADERNCRNRCAEFSCVSGSCVPWRTTCTPESVCSDRSHQPRICGERSCPLNQLDCHEESKGEDLSTCQSSQGCNFDDGFCGLDEEGKSDVKWVIITGKSPSLDTGPSYDHSTLSTNGAYIYLEASQRLVGDRARLLTRWLATGGPRCLQFWYHMFGRHVGSLNVLIKTNTSESLIWSQTGGQGDKWILGQVPIHQSKAFKIVLEAVVGNGQEGDIAVDDWILLRGSCRKIIRQEVPGCDFSDSKCGWTGSPDWTLHDGSVQLSGGSGNPRLLTSPPINQLADKWQCIKFWYYSGAKYFKRFLKLVIRNQRTSKDHVVWSHDQVAGAWMYVQLPLNATPGVIQIIFRGFKRQKHAVIALGNVSFSKEPCHKISASLECHDYAALNGADRTMSSRSRKFICDDTLDFNRWYRVMGAAGVQLATKCEGNWRCNTRYSGWMDGEHPKVEDGIVERKVCFAWSWNHCCRWNRKIKVRNCGEFFVYKLAAPVYCEQRYCTAHSSSDRATGNGYEEWRSWSSGSSQGAAWVVLDSADSVNLPPDRVEGQEFPKAYELHLNKSRLSKIRLRRSTSLPAVTLCFWLHTNATEAGVTCSFSASTAAGQEFGIRALGSKLEIAIMGLKRIVDVQVNDGAWHHVCLVWTSTSGKWELLKDGGLAFQGDWPYNPEGVYLNASLSLWTGHQELGRFSGVNVWDAALSKDHINHLSYGCHGVGTGSVISWLEVLQLSEAARAPASCNIHQGRALVLVKIRNSSERPATAQYVSPWRERSESWFGECLKFKYKFTGTAPKELWVYEKLDYDFEGVPLWAVKGTSNADWLYGQVPIATVSKHKIVIKGALSEDHESISIGGLFTAVGYCDVHPPSAIEACKNQNLTGVSGTILSPLYPGYYTNNTDCTWRILAPENHRIRLKFTDVQLEEDPVCGNDYVEVRDGAQSSSRLIARYCGREYPEIVESSSNAMFIRFKTNNVVVRTGFKASYQTEVGEYVNCIHGCPQSCTCYRTPGGDHVIVQSTNVASVPKNFPKDTAFVLFSGTKITDVRLSDFADLEALDYIDVSNAAVLRVTRGRSPSLPPFTTLRLNGNFIQGLQLGTFKGMANLETLDLGQNLLADIPDGLFDDLMSLKILSIRSNRLKELHIVLFRSLGNLTYLSLQSNMIQEVHGSSFATLAKLKVLALNDNKLKKVSPQAFDGLHSLEELYLEDNRLKGLPSETFEDLDSLRLLKVDYFMWCCYAEKSVAEVECVSPESEFSSCDDLMKNKVLTAFIWILGLLSLLGNSSVIVVRIFFNKDFRVHSILLTNLAVADFLMGFYLLIIAVKDIQWKGEYFQHDLNWRSGLLCQITGFLSVVSSEASVLSLLLITAERFFCIVFPFRVQKLSRKSCMAWLAFIWGLTIVIAAAPLSNVQYFFDERWDVGFYGRSAVCLPMILSSDQMAGWEYSVAIFIALNFVVFVLILLAYITMFFSVQKSSRAANVPEMKNHSRMARRMALIVFTDFCCWMPVVVIGILSLLGSFHDPTKQAYAWIAVFVLPVNSSINPILYTFSRKHNGTRQKSQNNSNSVELRNRK